MKSSDAKYAGMDAEVIAKLKERERVYNIGGSAATKLNRFREDCMVKMGDPKATVEPTLRGNDFVAKFNEFAEQSGSTFRIAGGETGKVKSK